METEKETNSVQDPENTKISVVAENKQPQEDKVPDSSENSVAQPVVKVANKGKKRKKPKDSTAPRHPLTGYVRFLNDRRENVRSENPALSFADITKLLASEWSNLPTEKKQQYLDAAEVDRERYTKEYNAYKQTEAYKLFTAQQNEKKKKETKEEPQKNVQNNTTPPLKENNTDLDLSNFDIPIFTEEFLDHNKTRDAELRQLRKSNTDFEQQNSVLQKHIENMKTAISKLETEISQQEKNNAVLQRHLDHLRVTLTDGFSSIKLPGMKDKATLQNIDSYMTNLHSILLENSTNDADLLKTVREIVGRLEFNG